MINKNDLSNIKINEKEISIIKYKFRNKKYRQQYINNLKPFEIQENFYLSFFCIEKEVKEKDYMANVKKISIEELRYKLSNNQLPIKPSTKIVFIKDNNNCKNYTIYNTVLQYEE